MDGTGLRGPAYHSSTVTSQTIFDSNIVVTLKLKNLTKTGISIDKLRGRRDGF
jgi:hypothetical protein